MHETPHLKRRFAVLACLAWSVLFPVLHLLLDPFEWQPRKLGFFGEFVVPGQEFEDKCIPFLEAFPLAFVKDPRTSRFLNPFYNWDDEDGRGQSVVADSPSPPEPRKVMPFSVQEADQAERLRGVSDMLRAEEHWQMLKQQQWAREQEQRIKQGSGMTDAEAQQLAAIKRFIAAQGRKAVSDRTLLLAACYEAALMEADSGRSISKSDPLGYEHRQRAMRIFKRDRQLVRFTYGERTWWGLQQRPIGSLLAFFGAWWGPLLILGIMRIYPSR